MTTAAAIGTFTFTDSAALKLSEEYCESQWYAAYTRANHEKRVSEQLDGTPAALPVDEIEILHLRYTRTKAVIPVI